MTAVDVTTFAEMIGTIIANISGAEPGSDRMTFHAEDGREFSFFHDQSCCEHVRIVDVIGDVSDLIGLPIVEAEEVSSADAPEIDSESYTWTFYRFSTANGTVTVRWLGESNGYYGEDVSYEVTP